MEVKEKIKVLVEIFDHRLAGINLEIPKSVRDIRLLQSTLDKYTPQYFERCQKVAYSILYLNLKQRVPGANKEIFFTQFMSSQLGVQSFQETLLHLHTVLPQNILVEDLLLAITDAPPGKES